VRAKFDQIVSSWALGIWGYMTKLYFILVQLPGFARVRPPHYTQTQPNPTPPQKITTVNYNLIYIDHIFYVCISDHKWLSELCSGNLFPVKDGADLLGFI
jgi:hypothetical protein